MGRFIPHESVDNATRWQFGALGDAGAAGTGGEGGDTVQAQQRSQREEELALAREDAFQQGFDAGVATARELATREIEGFLREQGAGFVQRLGELGDGYAHELDALRDALAGRVAELARELARQVLRTELATHPEVVAAVTRESLALLAQEHAPRVVHLHPDDLALVQRQFSQAPMTGQASIQWQADPQLTPGGCRVECAGALIDGSLQRRWQQAVDLLGVPAPWQPDGAAPDPDGAPHDA